MEKEIYKIIDKEKLHVVSESIEKAHGLPNECYLSGPYANIERKKIFEDKWVTIGVASSLPNPGDTKPFDLLGIPNQIILGSKSTSDKFEFKEIDGKSDSLSLDQIKNKLLNKKNIN